MTADTKQYIQLHLSILKEAMKQEGLIFGIAVKIRTSRTIQGCALSTRSSI